MLRKKRQILIRQLFDIIIVNNLYDFWLAVPFIKCLKNCYNTRMTEKLAIITSGGGTRCCWGAGAMLALAKHYNFTEPDILIACSGSAGTGSYYVAKQYHSIKNIWGNLLASKKFLNHLRFWKIIDIDYLIDEIFKKQDPLETDKIYSSSVQYFISAVNCRNGEIEYFSNQQKSDIFQIMRATKAMELAYKIKPKIFIEPSFYSDSMLTSSAETHIKKAVTLGATKILLIDNADQGSSGHVFDQLYNFWLYFQNKNFKRGYQKNVSEIKKYVAPGNVKIFCHRPKNILPLGLLDNNHKRLKQALLQGFEETAANQELADFLSIDADR